MACLSTILRSAFAAAIAAVLAASDTRSASAAEQIDISSFAASEKSPTFDEPDRGGRRLQGGTRRQ